MCLIAIINLLLLTQGDSMAATLVELTANIVSSHATGTKMTADDLIQDIKKVYAALKKLEADNVAPDAGITAAAPAMTLKKAFHNDHVSCLICGRTGFKTLTRHLRQAHDLKPGQYRKQFNIPSNQSLTAKSYSESRRKAANKNNLAANLEKARAVKAAKKTITTKAQIFNPTTTRAKKGKTENPATTSIYL